MTKPVEQVPYGGLRVVAANGIPFHVRIVKIGDKYGRDHCLTFDDFRYLVMVEFYDARYDFKSGCGWGQFVSRYFASTIMEDYHVHRGICLDGGIPAWSIDADTFKLVRDWIASLNLTYSNGGDNETSCTHFKVF